MACGATKEIGGLTVRCEMTGHRRPWALGPTHQAVVDGAVIRWATNPHALQDLTERKNGYAGRG